LEEARVVSSAVWPRVPPLAGYQARSLDRPA
jgi:hypothetical protein